MKRLSSRYTPKEEVIHNQQQYCPLCAQYRHSLQNTSPETNLNYFATSSFRINTSIAIIEYEN